MSDQYNNGNPIRTAAAPATMSRGVPALSLNLGAATAAVAAPMLNVRAAGAAGMGLADLGQGIGQAGDALARLASQQAENVNANHILEAEGKMSSVKDEIAVAWLNEPDETKWKSIAEEKMSTAEGTILHDGLSPDARDNISARMVRWRGITSGEALVASATRSREKLTGNLHATGMQMAAAGNAAGAGAVYDEMGRRGLWGADRVEAAKQDAAREAEAVARKADAELLKAHEGNIINMAKAGQLDLALKQLEAPGFAGGKAAPEDLEAMRNRAQAAWRDRAAATSEDVTNRIYDPDNPLTVAELNAMDSPFLTPTIRKAMKDRIGAFRADKVAEFKAEHGTENFVRTMRAAREVDFSKLHPDKAAELFDSMIADVRATVDDDRAGEVTQLLHQKFGSKAANLTAAPEVREVVSKNMALSYEMKADETKAALAAAEAALKADGGDTDANRKARDAAKKADITNQQAINKQLAAIERRMKPWYQANPDADETKALNEAAKLMAPTARKSLLDARDEADRAKAAGPGYQLGPVPTDADIANDQPAGSQSSADPVSVNATLPTATAPAEPSLFLPAPPTPVDLSDPDTAVSAEQAAIDAESARQKAEADKKKKR